MLTATANTSTSAATDNYSIFKAGNRYSAATGDTYLDEIQPIISQRCAVCHSCTNGPCQLNMTSYDALKRGMHKVDPYATTILPTLDLRLTSNLSTQQWRETGFEPVLPDSEAGISPENSILYKALEKGLNNDFSANKDFNQSEIRRMLAMHNKVQTGYPQSESEWQLFQEDEVRNLTEAHINQEYACPVNEAEWQAFDAEYPSGGMPWALPKLDQRKADRLMSWVRNGGQGPARAAQAAIAKPQITTMTQEDPAEILSRWDDFLNNEDIRYQLVGRYIYEHSFLANVQFAENPGEFYKLVRSSTPFPAPIQQIVTERVQDDPGIDGRVYYRFRKIDRVIEAKSHVLWDLSLDKLAHLEALFFAQDWELDALPGYATYNPFMIFEKIPTASRARFMIENARLITQSIARGPICFRQTATYGVDEYFWKFYLKPESDPSVLEPKLGLDSYEAFYRPANPGTSPLDRNRWSHHTYRQAFEDTLRRLKPQGLSLDDIWYGGEEKNPNALMMIHRHQNSTEGTFSDATTMTGMPHTVHLISYSGHEQYYYNEAAQYRFWYGVNDKLETWDNSMHDRTESEDLYISLFPSQQYREQLKKKYTGPLGRARYPELKIDYARGRPSQVNPEYDESALLKEILQRMGPEIVGEINDLNNWPNENLPAGIAANITTLEQWETGIRALTGRPSTWAGQFPNIAHVRLGGKHLYSFTVDRGYTPNKIIVLEKISRKRSNDKLMASRGLLGVAPEMFFDISFAEASAFLQDLQNLSDAESWQAFVEAYGIERGSVDVWPFVDWLHSWQTHNLGAEAGLLEMRFYDRSDKPF